MVLEEEGLFGVPSPRLLPRVSNSAVPLGSDSSCCQGLLCASCSLHLIFTYQGNPAKGVLSFPFYRRKVESWKVQFLAPQIPLLVSIWAVFREFTSRGRAPFYRLAPASTYLCDSPNQSSSNVIVQVCTRASVSDKFPALCDSLTLQKQSGMGHGKWQ